MKKIISLTIAVVIACSSFAIYAFATDTITFKQISVDKFKESVNKITLSIPDNNVKAVIDANNLVDTDNTEEINELNIDIADKVESNNDIDKIEDKHSNINVNNTYNDIICDMEIHFQYVPIDLPKYISNVDLNMVGLLDTSVGINIQMESWSTAKDYKDVLCFIPSIPFKNGVKYILTVEPNAITFTDGTTYNSRIELTLVNTTSIYYPGDDIYLNGVDANYVDENNTRVVNSFPTCGGTPKSMYKWVSVTLNKAIDSINDSAVRILDMTSGEYVTISSCCKGIDECSAVINTDCDFINGHTYKVEIDESAILLDDGTTYNSPIVIKFTLGGN